uniref:DNA-binding protein inhibitor ID-4 n=1 Tax=Marmota marmota marmota TaxID=9994 RepID=A0A8C6EYF5_MARMA
MALRCLAQHGHSLGGSATATAAAAAALCKVAEVVTDEPELCLLVPTIPPNKKVSKVEILQHVIDYILDLQLALETHPALLRQPPALLRQPPPPAPPHHPAGSCPAAPLRTPLTALNTHPVRDFLKYFLFPSQVLTSTKRLYLWVCKQKKKSMCRKLSLKRAFHPNKINTLC